MYTDFHDQNHNSISPSVVMPAVKNNIIRHKGGFELFRPDGQAPFAYFDDDDYIRDSFVLTNSCGSDGIKLGSVNIGMMKVTVKNENVARIQSPDMLMNCVAHVSFELTVDDNTTVDVFYGAYFVKEVEQLAEGVKLTAYDGMCKLDTPFSGALSGTPYQILTAAATACGVRVQSTQAEIEALPNGTKTFTLHEDNDCKTWRDVLSYLSALMGCFVTFGRLTYGTMTLPGIEVRPFGGGASSFCDTITDSQRYTGAKFSLWDTAYAEFTLKAYALEDPNDPDSAKKQDFTYTDTTISTEGQTIDLGYNPFLQATTPETGLTQDQIAILHDLLEKVATYQYTPMQISLPVGFIYDLGDVIKCTGRLANTGFAGGSVDDAYGVILNETYTYGRDYRIKSLDSHAGKGRAIVSVMPLNVRVIGADNAMVTATDGTHTFTAEAVGRNAVVRITESGTYTVTASLNGTDGWLTATVAVDVSSGEYSAIVGFVDPILNKNSWAVISEVSEVGIASSIWNTEDVKAVRLLGTIGTLAVDMTTGVYIAGFDHNWETEGKGIRFGCFKRVYIYNEQALGIERIALCDSKYLARWSSYDGTKYFQMNHWGNGSNDGTSIGGWAACDMRYDILGSTDVPPSGYGAKKVVGAVGYDPTPNCATNPVPNTLMSCLPADLRAVMKPITLVTDGVGNNTASTAQNTESDLRTTKDYLPLFSRYEPASGTMYVANLYEKNYQHEMASHPNIDIYRHDNTSQNAYRWERSPSVSNGFTMSYDYNTSSYRNALQSLGIHAMFMV